MPPRCHAGIRFRDVNFSHRGSYKMRAGSFIEQTLLEKDRQRAFSPANTLQLADLGRIATLNARPVGALGKHRRRIKQALTLSPLGFASAPPGAALAAFASPCSSVPALYLSCEFVRVGGGGGEEAS